VYCENCGINVASYHLVKIINGTKAEYSLCGSCAAKLGYTANSFGEINIPVAIFPEFTEQKPVEFPRTCQCGMSLQNFQKNGLLGCPNCYTTFEDELNESIKRLQGASLHIGRHPDDTPAKMELAVLRQKLKDAVANEDYESAAKIRDEIKEKE